MSTFSEVERKFLVNDKLELSKIEKRKSILQGYLLRATDGSARIRIENRLNVERAWLVIKQIVDSMTNNEVVIELPIDEAKNILNNNCSKPFISKTRYSFIDGKVKWEIDEFHEHKKGLILAEVELQHLPINERNITLPEWIEKEVTGDFEYYNANM